MISVSQDKNTFFYIYWVPSEKGPLVLDFGKEIIKHNLDYHEIYYNALNKIRLKTDNNNYIYSISIDSEIALYTETMVDENFDHFDVLEWFNKKTIGNESNDLNETFHYPFSSNQNKYLNIHFRSQIKNKIKLFAQDNNLEIRNIGLGIFSAEISARTIYNADYNKSYAILKISNQNEVLIINEGQLVSYLYFTIENKKIIITKSYGSMNSTKKILKDLDILISKNNTQLKSVEHLYFYQGKGKYKEIDNLLKCKNINVTPINIFSKLKLNKNKKISILEGMQYAETGCSLWGLDV